MIHFDFDSARIRPEGKKLLDGVADMLNDELSGRKYAVQGHTDNIGSRSYNLKLSLDRARSVREYLLMRGVDPDRLEITGYGFARPLYDNMTEEGRAKNRRVEFQELS